jgi:hypothetical protein
MNTGRFEKNLISSSVSNIFLVSFALCTCLINEKTIPISRSTLILS